MLLGDAIRSFCAEQRDWLEAELQSEQREQASAAAEEQEGGGDNGVVVLLTEKKQAPQSKGTTTLALYLLVVAFFQLIDSPREMKLRFVLRRLLLLLLRFAKHFHRVW